MNKIHRIIIFTVALSLIGSFGLAIAQESTLENEYPKFDGLPNDLDPPSSNQVYLGDYIRYIYYGAIIMGGLIVLLVLVMGGFRFLTSVGNPAAITDARNQMMSGFLGLVLILGSYIILNEINPDLISLEIPTIQSLHEGIMLYNVTGCANLGSDAGTPQIKDLDDAIRYKLMDGSGSADMDTSKDIKIFPQSFFLLSDPVATGLEIEFYKNEDCTGSGTTLPLVQRSCTNFTEEVKCIRFIWRTPGIWLFNKLTKDGKPAIPTEIPIGWNLGEDYVVIRRSQDLPRGFVDNLKSIAIMASEVTDNKYNYGVILHNLSGGINGKDDGWVHIYLPTEDFEGCEKIERTLYTCGPFSEGYYGQEAVNSATVFRLPPRDDNTAEHSIKLYKMPRYAQHLVDTVGGDPTWYDAFYPFTPEPSMSLLKKPGEMFDSSKVAYIKTLKDTDWEDYKDKDGHPVKIKNAGLPDGVSSIRMPDSSQYILVLYPEQLDANMASVNLMNTKTQNTGSFHVSSNVINSSNPDLKGIQMDKDVGTIVILKYSTN